MDPQELRHFGQMALDLAQQKGASGSDIIGAQGKSFSLSAQGGEIDKFKVTSSNIIGLRVIKDQKIGISYTESFDEKAIKQMVSQAIEISQFSGIDEYQDITIKNSNDFIESNPSLYQVDNTSVDEKIEMALALETKVLGADKRVKNSPYNAYGDGESLAVYMNHLGTFCSHKEKAFSCYTSVLAEENGKQAVFGESKTGRTFKELDVDYCVKGSLKHAIPLISGKAVPTGKYDLIFDPDQLDQFLGCFFSNFSGKSAKEGKSRFREKLDQTVASPLLTFNDRPQYKGGFYYSSFDDEGVPRKDLCLIQDGILKNLYHNTATAKFFGKKTTGHGARSARGGLGVSGTHIVIEPGTTEEADVRSGEYVEVIGLKGLHSGTNAISGQFSLAIDGIFYKDHVIQHYIRDMTISGSFYQILESVLAVGNTIHQNASRTFFAPTIRFGNISFVG